VLTAAPIELDRDEAAAVLDVAGAASRSAGARQFARLSFDYNRSFQQIEFPQLRVTHSSGGTADILPSAISDQPNPAVVNAPAYQDVRVKSVRILGLAPNDLLEYRVVTTTTNHHHPPPQRLESWRWQ